MSDKKISQLVAATTPMAGTELVPVVQGGVTKKASVSDLQCGPVAQVYQSSAQTLSSATFTLLQFQTELNDPNGCFNNTASPVTLNGLTAPAYSFTPNQPGWYQISAGMLMATVATCITTAIYKNGSLAKLLTITEPVYTQYGMYGSGLVYLNGTGDYVQIYGRLREGQALTTGSDSTYADFVKVR